MSKKSSERVLIEAFVFGKLKDLGMPLARINHRRLSIDEIKKYIIEEFGKAKKASDEEVQDQPGGWGDAELEKNIEWIKALDLKEFFEKKSGRK